MTGKNVMMKKVTGKTIAKNIPVLNVMEVVKEITVAAKEYAIVCEQEDTKRIEIGKQRDCIIENIRSRKEVILRALDKVYDERAETLKKQFDVIDYALDNDNIEILQVGLGAVIKLVETSPIANFKQFSLDYNDPNKVIDI